MLTAGSSFHPLLRQASAQALRQALVAVPLTALAQALAVEFFIRKIEAALKALVRAAIAVEVKALLKAAVNTPSLQRDDKIAIRTLRDHTEYTMPEISRRDLSAALCNATASLVCPTGPSDAAKAAAKEGKLSDEQL
ncbi:hypothetical protein THARTR1_11254 [Trichoderma harzianum]|uniref:Uncharacterized protein n=1 Tax=Trichoderma harzianum TaxID=5544 RepID=A0A2K0T3Q5_TRIHA|nr:hypothetical protein THARTR1_11254 [Trichoderma harzianum]